MRYSRSARLARRAAILDTPARPQGIALDPPDYGIHIVDHQLVQQCAAPIQRETQADRVDDSAPGLRQPNRTGLPDALKAGIESLSGLALDDVRVRFNSSRPAQLQALAYTQGSEIHVASGQERHLPHEAWHVVQQRQGRVRPSFQLAAAQINDDQNLEHEADVMGARAAQLRSAMSKTPVSTALCMHNAIQRMIGPAPAAPAVLTAAARFQAIFRNDKYTKHTALKKKDAERKAEREKGTMTYIRINATNVAALEEAVASSKGKTGLIRVKVTGWSVPDKGQNAGKAQDLTSVLISIENGKIRHCENG